MVKKKAETTFPEPEVLDQIPEHPDPEASNIEGLGGMSRSGSPIQ